ncbi:hypothetical protein AURDEDRAFT_162054 [Auricularia subglabra TFB-10046 SS5]|nr:hypothetical protein AURDEDRAFT_162054 [Auricularia subglabra TFB-10046 SS5]
MSSTATPPTGAVHARPPHASYTYSYGEEISTLTSPRLAGNETNGKARSLMPLEISEEPTDLEDGRRKGRRFFRCLRTRVGRWVTLAIIAAVFLAFTLVFGHIMLVDQGEHGPPEILSVGGAPPRQNGIFLYGGIRKWDMGGKTLSLRWIPYYCGHNGPKDCLPLREDAWFFTNEDALGIGGFNKSKSVLEYQAAQAGLKHDGWEQYIELDVGYVPRSGELNVNGLETDTLYPFDWYRVQILFAATEGDTNTTRPIIGANIFNKIQTQWVASFNYTYLDNFGPDEDHAAKLTARITLQRNNVIKVSAMLILIVNWLVTLAILYMTLVYILGRRQLPDSLDSIALPFTGLFALPATRNVMPGDPPFGCLIDFIGVIPNICIVSVCATLLLFNRIHREANTLIPERKREATR